MAIQRSSGDISVGTPAPTWFVSYSDLVTQLTVFFVMLFALGSAQTKTQLEHIEARLRSYARENHIEGYVHMKTDPHGLTVSLSDKLMFRSGDAELASEEARTHIQGIARILMEYPNVLSIEGHTDNRPVRNSEKYPTNWELSTARATNLARYLVEHVRFPPDRLSSAGYAEYHPVGPNDTEEGLARNRRVDIVVSVLTIAQQKEARRAKGLEGKEFQAAP